MMRLLPVAAATLFIAGNAWASESEPQDAPTEETAKEKLVCKSQAVTGYRARRVRTCMTQREWDRLAAGSRRGADEYIEELNRAPAEQPAG